MNVFSVGVVPAFSRCHGTFIATASSGPLPHCLERRIGGTKFARAPRFQSFAAARGAGSAYFTFRRLPRIASGAMKQGWIPATPSNFLARPSAWLILPAHESNSLALPCGNERFPPRLLPALTDSILLPPSRSRFTRHRIVYLMAAVVFVPSLLVLALAVILGSFFDSGFD